MEANIFPRAEVQKELAKYIRVRLYTDGDGEIHRRNQQLQQEKYHTVALPYYAIVNHNGVAVANFPGLTRDSNEFIAFLQRAFLLN